MRITIHQPEHVPWLGFFHKLGLADIYVVLDNVQFRKNYFQNRNKIRTPEGWQWITVPVHHSIDTLIKDVTIVTNNRWKKKWLDSINFRYRKAPYFADYYQEFENLISEEINILSCLNLSLIRLICRFLDIKAEFVLASQLSVEGKGSDLILNLCKKVGAEVYLSGISGREYLKTDDFLRENIKIEFQEFHHPVYRQLYGPFIPCLSIIDLLFNYGRKSTDIINGIGVEIMDEVFL